MNDSLFSDIAVGALRPVSAFIAILVWSVLLWPAGWGGPGWLSLLLVLPAAVFWFSQRLRGDLAAALIAGLGGIASIALGALIPVVGLVVGFGAAGVAIVLINRGLMSSLADLF